MTGSVHYGLAVAVVVVVVSSVVILVTGVDCCVVVVDVEKPGSSKEQPAIAKTKSTAVILNIKYFIFLFI